MQKRLSVIIPGYNTRPEWWSRCVGSVRQACSENDEIICIDDGSNVPVQANWVYADIDKRIRLIRKENGGLSSARNLGLEVIKGKWVAFVDSDDEIQEDVFDKCISSLEETCADVAIYGVRVVWTDERLYKIDLLPDCYYGALSYDDVVKLCNACLLNYACNKVYSADFIGGFGNERDKIRFNKDGMPCEDIIFNLECIMANAKWVVVGCPGYVYYRCGTTLLSSYKPSNDRGLRLCTDTWRKYARTLGGKDRLAVEKKFVMSEDSLLKLEWQNLWMPHSPYSFAQRWRWLRKKRLGGPLLYLEMLIRQFVRKYFYSSFIRKWRISRLYPKNIMPLEVVNKEEC